METPFADWAIPSSQELVLLHGSDGASGLFACRLVLASTDDGNAVRRSFIGSAFRGAKLLQGKTIPPPILLNIVYIM